MKIMFLSTKNRDIGRLYILIIVSFCLFITSTFAWFTYIITNEGIAPELKSIDLNYVNTVLYHQIYDASGNLISEEQVTDLVISDFVPEQTEYYRFEITNANNVDSTISATIVNLNADFTASSGAPQPDIELAKVIKLMDVYAVGNTGTPIIDSGVIKNSDTIPNGETLYNLYSTGSDTNINLVQNIVIPSGKTANVYFKFHMIKEANNYYQFKSIKIESISIAKA